MAVSTIHTIIQFNPLSRRMHLLLSPPSSNLGISIFSPAQNPNCLSKFTFKLSISLQGSPISLSVLPCCSSRDSAPVLEELYSFTSRSSSGSENGDGGGQRDSELKKQFDERVLVVRRPVLELDGDGSGLRKREEAEDGTKSSAIDVGLKEISKNIPTFEPVKRIGSGFLEKPLTINLDLALYKAKVLARNYQYEEAEKILEKCIYWPEDGRSYVALGKTLSKQRKTAEARSVYERGCQATQGENAYIWQCWAVLESKMGNVRKARELFDASTVADKKHVAAWHGWACLELRQGNIKKARNLLGKGLKYCGGNEYIYQTLALFEVKSNRFEQARYLFNQATMCNPNSCASWLAWAQLEMQQENNHAARTLFEKAVQASPKNRFAWHVWGLFEANMGNIEKGRKLLMIGHALNPRDPVLLQSLALLEYKYSTANLARVLFRRASELDPRHQPVWIAWGWMEWKEGNVAKARELYQRALSINTTTESAARCLQAWGVLEQRLGNVSAARRLFRSSININSQSYVTWMTWASLEEDQGNAISAEEIRDLYFQQRTEVVADASWVTGLLDVIDPALDSIKRLLKLEQDFQELPHNYDIKTSGGAKNSKDEELASHSFPRKDGSFDVDAFILKKLSLDASKLVVQMEKSRASFPRRIKYIRKQSDTEIEHQVLSGAKA